MRIPIRGAILVAAVGGTALACRPQPAALSAAHAAAIRDSVTGALASFQMYSGNAEWDSLASLYSDAPAFRFLESGLIQYASAADVRRALGGVGAGVRINTTHHDVLIDPIAPGLAVSSMLFESTFADSTGPRLTVTGAVTLVWVHEADGWRIRHGHSSQPVPRPH